jgi:diguanylate cyclase (GGDEF)-like protein
VNTSAIRRLAALGQSGDPAAVQEMLAALLLETPGVEQVHVLGLTGDAQAVAYRNGGTPPEIYRPTPGEAFAWVTANGRPIAVDAERAAAGLGPELSGHYGVAGALLLPFAVNGQPRAIVALGGAAPRTWAHAEIESAGALLDVAGLALAAAEVRSLARLDPLTGCLNAEAMRARLAEEIGRAARSETALAVVLYRIGGVSDIAERHGVPVADALLRHVAGLLRGQFRASDQVARLDETAFAVIVPDAPTPLSDMVARRALRLLGETRITTAAGDQELDVVMGLAGWRPPESADELLGRAAQAMRGQ